ncbi:hypothetical protein QBC33DRAFT_199839 [Phialemonium atrogriseum]|uniref:Uncharacterized protein n=1 Tax=Phialemonium atrogriseum TaxID=1093897 RepID=A0AAJ0FKU7_9PEZI|nr:uncharacterized protein QBC33DRAFT_199839 [Phialemonium atrogriseum]KAK1764445.1 hypothetical protein QBC33DRAFT_199839 [Phialemonium atrogriseum]
MSAEHGNQRAQSKTRKRHSSQPEHEPVEIPYENFVGAVLGGCFQVQGLKLQGDQLDIYSVTNIHGGDVTFEAQAFPLSYPLGKLLKSRMRKAKRMYRSRNFQCEFNWDGRRFFVSHVVRSEAEWRNLVAEKAGHVDDGESDEEDFPPLPSVRMLAISRTREKKDAQNRSLNRMQEPNPERSSRLPNRIGTGSPGRPNYAEAATRGQMLEANSTTSKGVRQRRRRQRRRDERGSRDRCQQNGR